MQLTGNDTSVNRDVTLYLVTSTSRCFAQIYITTYGNRLQGDKDSNPRSHTRTTGLGPINRRNNLHWSPIIMKFPFCFLETCLLNTIVGTALGGLVLAAPASAQSYTAFDI